MLRIRPIRGVNDSAFSLFQKGEKWKKKVWSSKVSGFGFELLRSGVAKEIWIFNTNRDGRVTEESKPSILFFFIT